MSRLVAVLTAVITALALAVPASAAGTEPNDEYWDLQWGPRQVNAPQAWGTSTGDGTTIAVLDTGVDLDHEDLAGKLVTGATFANCDDDDGDGLPDRCGNGDWEDDGDAEEGSTPYSEHGTHVAGIAGAITDNGTGVAGVAPDASLMPVKVLDGNGGSFSEIAAGIYWATDNGANVINMSLGAPPGVQALTITGLIDDIREAVDYAVERGVAVIAAAGNDFASICGSPSFDPDVLCVVSTNVDEARSSFSNFALDETPDNVVAAPGGDAVLSCERDVISTIPMDAEEGFCEGRVGTPNYDFYAGTSMSTPHVAGTASLLLATGYAQSGRELVTTVYDCLENTARDPGAFGGAQGTYDPVYGYGIVDAAAAVSGCGGDGTTTDGSGDGGTTDGDGGDQDDEDRRDDEKRRDDENGRDGDDRGGEDRRDDENGRDGDDRGDRDARRDRAPERSAVPRGLLEF